MIVSLVEYPSREVLRLLPDTPENRATLRAERLKLVLEEGRDVYVVFTADAPGAARSVRRAARRDVIRQAKRLARRSM